LGVKSKILKIAKWILAVALIAFGFLFAATALYDFLVGTYSLGIAGLILSVLLLSAGLLVLGKLERLREAKKLFGGGPYSRNRDLRAPYLIGGLLFSIIILASLGITRGVVVPIFLAFYFLGFPLGSWYVLSGPAARIIFVKFISSKRVNGYLSIVLRERRQLPEYFLTSYGATPSIWTRFAQVVFFSFALTAALLPFVVALNTANQVIAEGLFVLVGIAVLAIPSLVYVVLWVYEDSGLRSYDSAKAMMRVPASEAVSLVTRVVGIGAFLRFVQVITSSSAQASGLALAIAFLLLSPILLVVTIYHHKLQPKIVTKFRETKIARDAQVTITFKP